LKRKVHSDLKFLFSINAICIRWRFLFTILLLPACLTAQGDLSWVNLHVKPDFKNRSIHAICIQKWKVGPQDSLLQLHLSPLLIIDSVLINGNAAVWNRDSLQLKVQIQSSNLSDPVLLIKYHGAPLEAKNAPWDGGFVWSKDPEGESWLTVACQDKGASIWWPAPAAYSDHPDSAVIGCTYPANLFFKGNGRLKEDKKLNKNQRFTSWQSTYPINTYNLTMNIGNYAVIRDTLIRRDGSLLELEYYPLKKNRAAALKQFQQVKPMLDCYERHFGPYPYQRDGFSIVEVPYAGMEHQGAIAYGNGYTNGYLGKDYSAIGLDFDFILIHESGHQWWGNSVTAISAADTWIHEAFCTYAEYVYVQCRYGDKVARDYINAKKRLVKNQAPILGAADSGIDMYVKGALMLYTLERLIGEGLWKDLLQEFSNTFQYHPIDTATLIEWFSRKTGRNLEGFFKQYLERADIPLLEYQILPRNEMSASAQIRYRVSNALPGFQLPIVLLAGGNPAGRIIATASWQETAINLTSVVPDESHSYFKAVFLKN
jgi:aminopeptidase N